MKRILSVFAVAAALAVSAAVSVDFKVEADHADCLYRCGETATFTVTVVDSKGKKLPAGTFTATLDNFGARVLAEKTADLAQGNPFTIAAAKDMPGFMRLSIRADAKAFTLPKTAGQGAFHWGVAYEPEKIRPGAENPADFDSFWADAVRKLDETVPEDAKLEKIDASSTAGHTYYRISFASHGGRRVWGWLNMPTGRGPFPVRVNVPGAGIGAKGTAVSDSEITLTMNVHSYPQPDTDAERQAAYKAQDEKFAAPRGVARYCQAGIHLSREDYFYYASLLGINRAVSWLWRQPQVDRRNFTYSGTSQGGGFGLMLTGLNGRFTRSCIFVPAITDLLGSRHEDRQSGWPRIIEAQKPENRAAAEKNAPYFDGVNFAARITCPVRVVVGFADCVCAPAGVYAAYNLIPSKDKKIIHGIGMGHRVYSRFYKDLSTWQGEKASGVRYFSNAGDDAADGLTPATAWRTLEKLGGDLPAGGEARLRRGDVFYGKVDLKSGPDAAHPTVLSAYGEGAAPEICAYKIAKADPSAWTFTGTNNLWRIDLADDSTFGGNRMTKDGNVGFLKVDGRIFGRKFFAKNGRPLAQQWDFMDDHRFLTVWSADNPARMAKDIRIAPNLGVIPFRNHMEVRDVVVRGTGGHGSNGVGFDVRFFDCGFYEIGGSHLGGYGNGVTRYGNGVECWAGASHVQVCRCAFADIYDVGFTMQGGSPSRSWENTHVTDCTFTRCTQCYELWTTKCRPGIGMKGCTFLRNRCVDTARGWAYDVRPDKANATPLLMYAMETDVCDILVKDNMFVNSRGALIFKSGGLADLPDSY
ncbi:MAG: acetylxylan esterase, partial [Kiritimatiellae bacterium]|nr:acetylxylan esterase [Kiritimatiellia bacterium]